MRFAELIPPVGSDRAVERHAVQLAEGLVRLGLDTELISARPALGARGRRVTREYDLVNVHGIDALSAFARAPLQTR